jgi:hypothetical protein
VTAENGGIAVGLIDTCCVDLSRMGDVVGRELAVAELGPRLFPVADNAFPTGARSGYAPEHGARMAEYAGASRSMHE